MVDVTVLTEWCSMPRLYVIVLDEHAPVYVGATSRSAGIAKRVRQHCTGQKQ